MPDHSSPLQGVVFSHTTAAQGDRKGVEEQTFPVLLFIKDWTMLNHAETRNVIGYYYYYHALQEFPWQ